MPDLATALTNALTAQVLNKDIKGWHEEEEKRINPPDRKNVVVVSLTEMVFNYIRDNPGVTGKQVGEWFDRQGYKISSTTSLAAQFVKAGMAHRDGSGRLHMLTQKYAPPVNKGLNLSAAGRKARKEDYKQRAAKRLATMAAKKQAAAQAAVVKREELNAKIVAAPGIAALQVQPTLSTLPQPTPPTLLNMTPTQIIDALSVRQARELYAALKEFFG